MRSLCSPSAWWTVLSRRPWMPGSWGTIGRRWCRGLAWWCIQSFVWGSLRDHWFWGYADSTETTFRAHSCSSGTIYTSFESWEQDSVCRPRPIDFVRTGCTLLLLYVSRSGALGLAVLSRLFWNGNFDRKNWGHWVWASNLGQIGLFCWGRWCVGGRRLFLWGLG